MLLAASMEPGLLACKKKNMLGILIGCLIAAFFITAVGKESELRKNNQRTF